jgi:hypothetical protein
MEITDEWCSPWRVTGDSYRSVICLRRASDPWKNSERHCKNGGDSKQDGDDDGANLHSTLKKADSIIAKEVSSVENKTAIATFQQCQLSSVERFQRNQPRESAGWRESVSRLGISRVDVKTISVNKGSCTAARMRLDTNNRSKCFTMLAAIAPLKRQTHGW